MRYAAAIAWKQTVVYRQWFTDIYTHIALYNIAFDPMLYHRLNK